ncbi:MAG: succinate dehydrogenase iron-sulfur subunit [Deltaproteobacteria bacterium]|nr:succinate dehydrogenase iron-sulfur subunit [Deltaproteobacteria bacterium]
MTSPAEQPDQTSARAKPGRVVRLRIRRQDDGESRETRRWERFSVPYEPGMTVATALRRIQLDPRGATGEPTAPVAWEGSCFEGLCGRCAMLVGGRVRLACATPIDEVAPRGQTITLEPLGVFPVLRDLVVDRGRLDDDLRRARAWLPVPAAAPAEDVPAEPPELQRRRLALAQCIGCASCLEACPELRSGGAFVGAAVVNEIRLLGLHRLGAPGAGERIEALMGPGGVAACGKAHNCVAVCPQSIPLDESLAAVARAATRRLLLGWLLGD